ncbi:MAG: ribonuclease E inhibitor RraB, partial [Steroidobacteraceae bacterium]|nr:ribonuclease E inhibitor RraB [Steroidobacteraceae bacterium]
MRIAYLLLLLLGGGIALARIWMSIKKARDLPAHSWDAKLIEKLRAQGSDPFQPHDVVFFFGLPDENAAQRVVERLVRDGFAAEYKRVPDQSELCYAVHAQRSIRLSVSDMQATSRKFNDMAAEFHGRYDGWAAAHNKR